MKVTISMHLHHTKPYWRVVTRYRFLALLVGIAGFYSPSSTAETNSTVSITYPSASTSQDQLIIDILQLAVSKSGKSHLYQLSAIPDTGPVEQELKSKINQIQKGNLSVMWAGAQESYESVIQPIKIPILKGLLGHRIFIIREDKQVLFNSLSSLEELKRLSLGQARFKHDTKILKQAKMTVVDPVKHNNLFNMLEGGRFDYFPRAVHEPWEEIQKHSHLPLTVENKILLVYPYAMYFYVSQENTELKNMLTQGFRNAIEDGSFDQLFFSNELIKTTFEKSHFRSRKVFHIPNPDFSASAYQQSSEMWLNIENL
ncbi:MAG: diguanylate cyclase [Agarilytica sp.]